MFTKDKVNESNPRKNIIVTLHTSHINRSNSHSNSNVSKSNEKKKITQHTRMKTTNDMTTKRLGYVEIQAD